MKSGEKSFTLEDELADTNCLLLATQESLGDAQTEVLHWQNVVRDIMRERDGLVSALEPFARVAEWAWVDTVWKNTEPTKAVILWCEQKQQGITLADFFCSTKSRRYC